MASLPHSGPLLRYCETNKISARIHARLILLLVNRTTPDSSTRYAQIDEIYCQRGSRLGFSSLPETTHGKWRVLWPALDDTAIHELVLALHHGEATDQGQGRAAQERARPAVDAALWRSRMHCRMRSQAEDEFFSGHAE
ncbi:hypothetical protein AC579_3784 [Pseudocercospora musae]|uniref:Uncharacterized protein n=1 Tax=Pseudocercospora musae TaxID=113226 RepID=A0A139INE9_9PEZI|nr:hypothetical protein AC579_3784 [Pseudocercospora musae]